MKQLQLFFTALMFITRIPVPKWVGYSEDNLNKCNRYFPLVGIIVGGSGALIYWLASFIFPVHISVLLSMITTILITGGFHEDGFADVCDGFGGGWTKEKILEIMKDSRVGAFGMIGTILLLMLKFFAISALPSYLIAPSLIAAHSISRTYAVSSMYTLPYVREDELSKSKPVTKNLHIIDLWIAITIGLVTLVIFQNTWVYLTIIPLTISKFWLDIYFKKWIGGYVGDCLGTIQQVTEVVFYLSLIALGSIFEMIN
jgi:adenosylcobinamide-GDP ribazoletransferase